MDVDRRWVAALRPRLGEIVTYALQAALELDGEAATAVAVRAFQTLRGLGEAALVRDVLLPVMSNDEDRAFIEESAAAVERAPVPDFFDRVYRAVARGEDVLQRLQQDEPAAVLRDLCRAVAAEDDKSRVELLYDDCCAIGAASFRAGGAAAVVAVIDAIEDYDARLFATADEPD